VLAEIPDEWSPFFELLASTGLRVSEAIALRWMDLEFDEVRCLCVRRSIVGGVIGAPKSRRQALRTARPESRRPPHRLPRSRVR
jgi:integrase